MASIFRGWLCSDFTIVADESCDLAQEMLLSYLKCASEKADFFQPLSEKKSSVIKHGIRSAKFQITYAISDAN